MKKFTLVIRGENNEKAFEEFRAFTVKKYQSSKFLSNSIMSLIRHNISYPDKIRSAQVQHNNNEFKGKSPEEVYRDLLDSLHQSTDYLIGRTALQTLIRRKFGVIDERTVRNWINKMVSEKYIAVGTGKDADRYTIRLNKEAIEKDEETEQTTEPQQTTDDGLTEEEKNIFGATPV